METRNHRPPWAMLGPLILLLGSVGVGLPALLLLAVATALNSRFLALAILVLLSIPVWWAAAKCLARRGPSLGRITPVLALACGLGVGCWICSPTGEVSPQSCLTSVYKGSARFNHLSSAWLVDEADQVRLGGLLLPLLDPAMSREQGNRFADTFNTAYANLGRSPEFRQIGSAMGEAYADMFLQSPPTGHAYLYHPPVSRTQRCPVIVFLHGWLGNLKPYVWSWSRFAEQHGFVIICPSFGNGLWKGGDADEMLQWLDAIIRADTACDPDRVYVVGLSNGGTGVTRWATRLTSRYRGLVFVSPVLEGTDTQEFVSAVGQRPVLVVHGGKDNRIPPGYVRQQVARMTAGGMRAQSICYEDEDHVLVLSSSNRLQADLIEWMNHGERESVTMPATRSP